LESGWRALRGGSWNNNQQNLRCSARNNNHPNNRNNNVGFRVVRRLLPQSCPMLPGIRYPGACPDLMPVFYGTPDCVWA
jgi:hypothetical protein